MKDLANLLLVLAQGAAPPRGPSLSAMAGMVLAIALAVLCATAAAGCLLAALWLYAIPLTGPAGAPLVVAGALLLASAAALAVATVLRRPRPAPPPPGGTAAMLLAALVAGIAAGSRRA
jgi:hypothetical protein